MINKVFLLGNLGHDPEVRQTASGMPVADFSLATNRRWTDSDGSRREQTEWHHVVCFARLAQVAEEYLARGRQVFVEGRIQSRSWEHAQTGETRYRTEVIAERLQMLGRPQGEGASEPRAGEDSGPDPEDDDIPF